MLYAVLYVYIDDHVWMIPTRPHAARNTTTASRELGVSHPALREKKGVHYNTVHTAEAYPSFR